MHIIWLTKIVLQVGYFTPCGCYEKQLHHLPDCSYWLTFHLFVGCCWLSVEFFQSVGGDGLPKNSVDWLEQSRTHVCLPCPYAQMIHWIHNMFVSDRQRLVGFCLNWEFQWWGKAFFLAWLLIFNFVAHALCHKATQEEHNVSRSTFLQIKFYMLRSSFWLKHAHHVWKKWKKKSCLMSMSLKKTKERENGCNDEHQIDLNITWPS